MEPPPIHKCHHVSPEVPLVALLWRLQLDLSIFLLVFFPPLMFCVAIVLLAKVVFEFIAFKVYSFGVESVIYFTKLCVCDTRFVLLTYL